jgi:hypothetical protein
MTTSKNIDTDIKKLYILLEKKAMEGKIERYQESEDLTELFQVPTGPRRSIEEIKQHNNIWQSRLSLVTSITAFIVTLAVIIIGPGTGIFNLAQSGSIALSFCMFFYIAIGFLAYMTKKGQGVMDRIHILSLAISGITLLGTLGLIAYRMVTTF